ncbi:hypothetical protein FOCC_FOCC009178 [Frankliniella occidentalis]|nr:hypothetical protein FOCC_FOCC009178 [Frankliniella occidentalis]
MPVCYVPTCKSRSGKPKDNGENVSPRRRLHFFRPPDEETRIKWDLKIKRANRRLVMRDTVCSEHFDDEYIIDKEVFLIDGVEVVLPKDRASLKKGALPTKFEHYPDYYKPKVTNKRKSPMKRALVEKNNQVKRNAIQLVEPQPQPEPQPEPEPAEPDPEPAEPDPEPAEHEPRDINITEPEWTAERVVELHLPTGWCVPVANSPDIGKSVIYFNSATGQVDKEIRFKGNRVEEIKFRRVVCSENGLLKTTEGLSAQQVLNIVHRRKVCKGTGLDDTPYSDHCHGLAKPRGIRCSQCVAKRELLRKIEQRANKSAAQAAMRKQDQRSAVLSLKRSNKTKTEKIRMYAKRVKDLMFEWKSKKEEIFLDIIKNWPEKQQEAAKACYSAANKKGKTGRRHTIDWVYECLLMRIKSPQLYEHIRCREILPLPCNSVMKGYLKRYSGAYGFQPTTFQMLKVKAAELLPEKRRGECVILVDEAKLTPGLHFDAETLMVEGFTYLGEGDLKEFGEEIQEKLGDAINRLPLDEKAENRKRKARERSLSKKKNKRDRNLGDHALVITFQPFQGNWVQNIACFLTRGAANDEQLTKLVLEAVLLMEDSDFFVDGVVTDGASWNRGMWKRFGVTEDNVSAEHPCDEERRLHFLSDYPHLLKCMRNCLSARKTVETEHGTINLDHWQAVVDADSGRDLKICPRLTQEHVSPDSWAKMRCNLAWQFWSESAATGMLAYKHLGEKRLEDCDISVKFCKLVNKLTDVMNSRIPKKALQPYSEQTQVIEEFLKTFKQMQDYLTAKRKAAEIRAEEAIKKFTPDVKFKSTANNVPKREYVFSESTDTGLIITLKTTLQLLKFLTSDKIKYKYLMTSRLNQDALERFFGLVRQSCGPNTHPEPRVFAQLFRLLSIYSLVKPVKGSNITGGEMLGTLINLQDLKSKSAEERKKEFDRALDSIVDKGQDLDQIRAIATMFEDEHNYYEESINEYALVYVAGYVSRKSLKFCHGCACCEAALKLADEKTASDDHLLIKLKSRGYLTFPSNEVVCLLKHLETQIINAKNNHELEDNILFVITEKLENSYGLNFVGCENEDHKFNVTKSIIRFYLIMRMHFLCKNWNNVTKGIRKTKKKLWKTFHQQ